jgi:purine-nucleoside phosphorylase
MAMRQRKTIIPILLRPVKIDKSAIFNYQFLPRNAFALEASFGVANRMNEVVRDLDQAFEDFLNRKRYKICVVTFLSEELVALTDHFEDNGSFREYDSLLNKSLFFTGKLIDRAESEVNIVATQVHLSSHFSLRNLFVNLVDEFNPQLIVLLNTAGTGNKRVNLHDVVVATAISDLSKLKGQTVPMSENTIAMIDRFNYTQRSHSPKMVSPINHKQFKVLSGDVGFVDHIQINDKLVLTRNDILAFNFELSFDYFNAFQDIVNEHNSPGVMIISGIADSPPFGKQDYEQTKTIAAHNAAVVFAEFVRANYF